MSGCAAKCLFHFSFQLSHSCGVHENYMKRFLRFMMSSAAWIIYWWSEKRSLWVKALYVAGAAAPLTDCWPISCLPKKKFRSGRKMKNCESLKSISPAGESENTRVKKFNSNWLTFILECNVIIGYHSLSDCSGRAYEGRAPCKINSNWVMCLNFVWNGESIAWEIY